MHIVEQTIRKKKLEQYDEYPNYTYVEKQYGQTFLWMGIFSTNNTVCMQLTRATTSDA